MQRQLLQLRKFAIICTWLGFGLFLAEAVAKHPAIYFSPPVTTSRWPVAAGCLGIALLNFIFLYCPKGSGKRKNQDGLQLLSFVFLILGILHGSGFATFAGTLFSSDSWTWIGIILYYSGSDAMRKYRQMLDELEPATFRNRTGQMLRRLRPWQIAMWMLFLWSALFLAPLFDIDRVTIFHGIWLTLILGGIGIAIYLASKIRRDWRCPACRTRLPLPRTAFLLLPKRLPEELKRCPHCGFDFDALPKMEAAAPPPLPAS